MPTVYIKNIFFHFNQNLGRVFLYCSSKNIKIMVSVQKIINFLSFEVGVLDHQKLNEHEEFLASELLAVLNRCSEDQSFAKNVAELLFVVNESENFNFQARS